MSTRRAVTASADAELRRMKRENRKLRRTRDVLLALQRASTAVVSVLDTEAVLQEVVQRALEVVDASSAAILTIGDDGVTLEARASAGAVAAEPLSELPQLRTDSPMWRALLERGEIIAGDVRADPRFAAYRSYIGGRGVKSVVVLPLVARERPIGLIGMSHRRRKRAFRREDALVLRLFAEQAAVVLDNRRLSAEALYIWKRLGAQAKAWRDVLLDTRDAIAIIDDRGIIGFGNRALFAILQRDEGEVVGQRWDKVLDPGEARAIWSQTVATMKEGVGRFPVNLLRRDGSRVPMVLRWVASRDPAGRLLGVIAALVDVYSDDALRERTTMLDAITHLAQRAARTPGIERLAERTLDTALALVGLEVGAVQLLEGDDLVVVAARGITPEHQAQLRRRTPAPGGVADRILRTRKPVVYADQRRILRNYPELRQFIGPELRSLLLVPITGTQRPVGLLGLAGPDKGRFTPEVIETIQVLAALLGGAVENIRLCESASLLAERRAVLNRAAERLLACSDHEWEVIPVMCAGVAELLQARRAIFFEYRVRKEVLRHAHAPGMKQAQLRRLRRLLPLRMEEVPLMAQAVAERRAVRCDDAAGEGALTPGLCEVLGLGAAVAVPVINQRELCGVLLVDNWGQPIELTPDDNEMVMALANQAAVSMDNLWLWREARQRSERLATAMQEAHHRIKNNLQAVCDVLELEVLDGSRRGPGPAIEDCVQRVRAIATVHELLSRDSDAAMVDVAQMVKRLTPLVVESTRRPDQRVHVVVNAQPLEQTSKRTTTIALIVNELVSNAVQHGLSDGQDGTVEVELVEKGGIVTLAVADDGAGVPAGFDLGAGARVGLDIARILAERDLTGSIALKRRGCRTRGAAAVVRFPK